MNERTGLVLPRPNIRDLSGENSRLLTEKEAEIGYNIIVNSLGVCSGERVLVVTDDNKQDVATIFFEAARKITPYVGFLSMTPRSRSGEEPPAAIASALLETDVFCFLTTYSLSHTSARLEACQNGARGFGMATPTLNLAETKALIARALSADIGRIARLTNKVANGLEGASRVRVLVAEGKTDISFSIAGRPIHRDTGIFQEHGSYGNHPTGEVYVAPIEGTANGIVIIDGNAIIPGVFLDQPLVLIVKDGVVAEVRGGAAAEAFRRAIKEYGPLTGNIAEWGIGTNRSARSDSGVNVEVEKVLGTNHFGFGNNATIGGHTEVPFHNDGVVNSPTVFVDDRLFMSEGKFRF